MRRSLAPSVQQAAKKPRFQPPFLSSGCKSQPLHSVDASDNGGNSLTPLSPTPPVTKTHTPLKDTENAAPATKEQDLTPDHVTKEQYYSVMWTKVSKKKHKTWEGDGILVTVGKTATLKDAEGKDIAKGTGYKMGELTDLQEGSSLLIGGKEIEVISKITQEDWMSGRCFLATATCSAPVSSSSSAIHSRPQPKTSSFTKRTVDCRTKPLYDVTASDAFVMPRPSQKHQMDYNSSGLPVVDVLVDPRLAQLLKPHQREGVTFLYECIMGMRDFQGHGAILADEMGLGKTLQCITAMWTLYKQGPYGGKPVVKKALVVTPGSLVQNWEREFHKWLGSERLNVYSVSSDRKVEDFISSCMYPVLIISYEMFLRTYESLSKVCFDLMVCDEGHRLKNTAIKTTSILGSVPVQRRIVLTGTPIQNDLQEFYSIVDFCNPGILGSQSAFHRVYEEPILQSRMPASTIEEKDIGENRAKELFRLTSLFCLRRTQELQREYLPPKVENVVFCEITPLQLKLYGHIIQSSTLKSCLSCPTDSQHLVCIGVLKKLCNSPHLLYPASNENADNDVSGDLYPWLSTSCSPEDLSGCRIEHSGKLKVLFKMLRSVLANKAGEKIVVVSHYTQTLDLLQKLLDAKGYAYLRLDGSTPTSKRQSMVERFNSSYCKESVFLLSSKAGGLGLNLIGASRLVLYDIDWNPANDLQAMARIWRDGQKKEVHIYRLLTAGTLEEKIYQRQISKYGLSTLLNEPMKNSGDSVHFSPEELKDLFSLPSGTNCQTHDLLDCNCQKNHSMSGEQCASQCETLCIKKPLDMAKMDGLRNWNHLSHPINEAVCHDQLLVEASDSITFVFQNRVQQCAL